VELISRMMDGSIAYDPEGRLEPVLSGPGAKQEDKIERLKEVSLFEECSQRQLRSVAKIARVFDVAAGTVLTRAGEPGDEFFLIIDGTARADVSADRHVLLHPGEFFGEMSLLDGGPRSGTRPPGGGARRTSRVSLDQALSESQDRMSVGLPVTGRT